MAAQILELAAWVRIQTVQLLAAGCDLGVVHHESVLSFSAVKWRK